MNNTKIEWADMTWNPVSGCLHNCEYCYARAIAYRFGGYDTPKGITTKNPLPSAELSQPLTVTRGNGKAIASPFPFGFEPTLHRYRLDEPKKYRKPKTIFVCSMADLFGDWVPDKWIETVFAACREAPWHRYLFLTKNPDRYMTLASDDKLPMEDNFWYGSTATGPDDLFWWSKYYNTFVSIEPLLKPFDRTDTEAVKKVDWIVMGAMTGPLSKKYRPEKSWVQTILADADAAGVPVLMKDSLRRIVGPELMRQDFPWDPKPF